MESVRVDEILHEAGAILQGHFVYASWKHGPVYINKRRVTIDPEYTSELCCGIAEAFLESGVEVVVGPERGGIILSQWVAYWLSRGRPDGAPKVLSVYAEKERDGFTFNKDHAAIVRLKQVLVVEDILNTGDSAQKTVRAVRQAGGRVVGVSAIVNRGGVTSADVGDVRLEVLTSHELESFETSVCPLCAKGVPINVEVGHGAEFLARMVVA